MFFAINGTLSLLRFKYNYTDEGTEPMVRPLGGKIGFLLKLCSASVPDLGQELAVRQKKDVTAEPNDLNGEAVSSCIIQY